MRLVTPNEGSGNVQQDSRDCVRSPKEGGRLRVPLGGTNSDFRDVFDDFPEKEQVG